jgi:SAM-dependent methyltransferase
MGDWIAFWNSDHSIYVNARHRDVHYRMIADDIARYVPVRDATVLDYGCGDALHADRIAAAAKRLILVEAAPAVRARLAARFKDHPGIEVRAPDGIGGLDRSVDIVVMNSVAQYLGTDELDALLARFRAMLKGGGLLIVGDVMAQGASAASDIAALLRLAAANGFLGAALFGLARTALSDYRRLRSTLGLTRYRPAAMVQKLSAAGFAAEQAPVNIGHNQARLTFLARLPPMPDPTS